MCPGKTLRAVLCIGTDTIGLRQRCAFLKERGWRVLSSTNGHDAIVRFVGELVDVVVLEVDGDGADAAVIAGGVEANQIERPRNHAGRRRANVSRRRH